MKGAGMDFNAGTARTLLEQFDFPKLFVEELGWDRHGADLSIPISSVTFALRAVAEKRGMVAWVCQAAQGQQIPDRATRKKIETQVAKTTLEHLIIFTDAARAEQIWCWARRETGKPATVTEHFWYASSGNRGFLQKLETIAFSLAEENTLTLNDVTSRARAAFDVERVTKRFFDQFKTEHKAFLDFIDGISEVADKEWYASLMLNRLMFIYFMQRKRFLDNKPNYLVDKLSDCQGQLGQDKFYSFYRTFLLRLFHEGLGTKTRNPEIEKLLGRIPYLNGGLFEKHPIEERCPDIQIPDEAFKRIFSYFDRYQWHLDERPLRNDNEINPDVLGYIFEKYINQKQMGAYYTKEDITEYISKSTVIPFLFDAAKAECKVAFDNPGGPTIWDHLRDNPERYIYASIKHGTENALPPEIADGINNVSARSQWNQKAPEQYGLPTEIWREVIARRTRFEEVRAKLAAGNVRDIDDLITLNLDIRQFAQDVIERCEGPDLLRAFWKAIQGVTILDPTCGSGAFLFAALNILEPLYETCLERMEAFVADLSRTGESQTSNKFQDFKDTLANVNSHPNVRYFTLKSIILNNLFGVDIMEEAVEICKLRLFLKLAAQVEPNQAHENLGIEPLPDIDFNIQAGNTLVGYATYAGVNKAISSKLDLDNASEEIATAAADLQLAADAYRTMQMDSDSSSTAVNKEKLRKRLTALEDRLNNHLATEYGIRDFSGAAYSEWCHSHQPFHWFIEFHGIMQRGGFDVIIGNPPYVQRSKIKDYSLLSYETGLCPDIYAPCIERSLSILRTEGRIGLIVPISFQFSDDFRAARQIVTRQSDIIWASTFSRNPAALFSAGLGVRNTVFLARRQEGVSAFIFTSRLHRWVEESRDHLFQGVSYLSLPHSLQSFGWPRLDNSGIRALFDNLTKSGGRLSIGGTLSRIPLRFKTTALYYLSVFADDPPSFDGAGKSISQTKVGQINFADSLERDRALAIALSKISVLWWAATGDDFDVTSKGLGSLPISPNSFSREAIKELDLIASKIKNEMSRHIIYTNYAGKRMGNYDIKNVRYITDEVDRLILREVGMADVWDDLELAYARFMKMTRERHGTTRGNMGDLESDESDD